jgi:hypothetical protein
MENVSMEGLNGWKENEFTGGAQGAEQARTRRGKNGLDARCRELGGRRASGVTGQVESLVESGPRV